MYSPGSLNFAVAVALPLNGSPLAARSFSNSGLRLVERHLARAAILRPVQRHRRRRLAHRRVGAARVLRIVVGPDRQRQRRRHRRRARVGLRELSPSAPGLRAVLVEPDHRRRVADRRFVNGLSCSRVQPERNAVGLAVDDDRPGQSLLRRELLRHGDDEHAPVCRPGRKCVGWPSRGRPARSGCSGRSACPPPAARLRLR